MQKKKEPGRISKSILTAIRNRPGYRPLDANITGGDIVIASYNVHKCIGIDKQFNPQRTADVISETNADVIALQEADRRFGERSGLLDLGLLERRHGLVPVPITTTMPRGTAGTAMCFCCAKALCAMCSNSNFRVWRPRGAAGLRTCNFPPAHCALSLRIWDFEIAHANSRRKRSCLPCRKPILYRHFLSATSTNGASASAHRFPRSCRPSTMLRPLFQAFLPFPGSCAGSVVLGAPDNLITSVEVHNTPLARLASDHLPIKAHLDLKTAMQLLESHNSTGIQKRYNIARSIKRKGEPSQMILSSSRSRKGRFFRRTRLTSRLFSITRPIRSSTCRATSRSRSFKIDLEIEAAASADRYWTSRHRTRRHRWS